MATVIKYDELVVFIKYLTWNSSNSKAQCSSSCNVLVMTWQSTIMLQVFIECPEIKDSRLSFCKMSDVQSWSLFIYDIILINCRYSVSTEEDVEDQNYIWGRRQMMSSLITKDESGDIWLSHILIDHQKLPFHII